MLKPQTTYSSQKGCHWRFSVPSVPVFIFTALSLRDPWNYFNFLSLYGAPAGQKAGVHTGWKLEYQEKKKPVQ